MQGSKNLPKAVLLKGKPQNKDAKSVCSGEHMESSYFGSSVNYGARDFYTSLSSSQTSKSSDNHRADETWVMYHMSPTEVNGGKVLSTIEESKTMFSSSV